MRRGASAVGPRKRTREVDAESPANLAQHGPQDRRISADVTRERPPVSRIEQGDLADPKLFGSAGDVTQDGLDPLEEEDAQRLALALLPGAGQQGKSLGGSAAVFGDGSRKAGGLERL